MNNATLVIPTMISVGIGPVVNFFVLRAVMRKMHKPRDTHQQTRLAAALAVLLSALSVFRIKRLAELAAAQPAERWAGA